MNPEEDLQMRRERHDLEMAKLRAEIAGMSARHDPEMEKLRAATALALREARFPSTVLAAFALALIAPWLLSLIAT